MKLVDQNFVNGNCGRKESEEVKPVHSLVNSENHQECSRKKRQCLKQCSLKRLPVCAPLQLAISPIAGTHVSSGSSLPISYQPLHILLVVYSKPKSYLLKSFFAAAFLVRRKMNTGLLQSQLIPKHSWSILETTPRFSKHAAILLPLSCCAIGHFDIQN